MPAPKKKKTSSKGIPKTLIELAERGERVRFNGGWLNDSEMDRVIAEWIDDTPQTWIVVKTILYQWITGNGIVQHQKSIQPIESADLTTVESAFADFDD